MSNLKKEIKKMKKELKSRESKNLFSWSLRRDIIILEAFAKYE